jgi:metal transporter CNNM
MDVVELEVLKRSGTAKEQIYAAAIMPLVSNQHFLLVTLLLCNAAAMEALPLFLDRLADPVTAILISVTAVLVFGEILPQAVCSR